MNTLEALVTRLADEIADNPLSALWCGVSALVLVFVLGVVVGS